MQHTKIGYPIKIWTVEIWTEHSNNPDPLNLLKTTLVATLWREGSHPGGHAIITTTVIPNAIII
jgi:hypothetical protein